MSRDHTHLDWIQPLLVHAPPPTTRPAAHSRVDTLIVTLCWIHADRHVLLVLPFSGRPSRLHRRETLSRSHTPLIVSISHGSNLICDQKRRHTINTHTTHTPALDIPPPYTLPYKVIPPTHYNALLRTVMG